LSVRLREELGLEPSRALRELELAILRQDESLEPKPRRANGPAGNLPLPSGSFVGRTRELDEVTGLLQDSDTRLLTLTGPGGSGKTRLAVQASQLLTGRYRDGVWFVGFADITDPDLIAPTIWRALELGDQPGVTAMARLKAWTAGRELLLVLDNLEQLADGASVLSELRAECAGLVLLVTSREPLRLSGEKQYEVPALALAEAVELFATRVRAVVPHLTAPAGIAERICERLDCLPLAIELAAARAKALSPDARSSRGSTKAFRC
jgi:predicted ATPase